MLQQADVSHHFFSFDFHVMAFFMSWLLQPSQQVRPGVARFFLVQLTKTRKNIPNDHKTYQTATKYAKWPQNMSNGHKICQMATKYAKRPQNMPNGLKMYRHPPLKTLQIYPNWEFCLENIPSGSPGSAHFCEDVKMSLAWIASLPLMALILR
jgi:hypothetical protein